MSWPTVRLSLVLAMLAPARPHPSAQAQSHGPALAEYEFGRHAGTAIDLPRRLQEVSGLTTAAGDRVFTHGDERGVVYEVDYRDARILKTFYLGDETVRADFEGIAFVDDRLYLVTSDGRLFEAREGRDGEHVLYNSYGTGVGRACRVEGLAYEPADRTLLLLCKELRGKSIPDIVVLYRWSIARRALAADSVLTISKAALTSHLKRKSFHPSGIERHPVTGTYFIIAGPEAAIAEVTPGGDVRMVRDLSRKEHPQAEGITLLSDLTLLIADEGGRGRGRLSLYPRKAALRD